MILKLGQFYIRNWQPEDETSLVRHANNRKIWLNLRDAFPHPYTLADALLWIDMVSAANPTTHFAIVIDGDAAGGIGLIVKEDVYYQSAEIGYWLGEEFWGRGIMTEAVEAITDYAFSNLNLCRIEAHIFDWNPASIRVLEKAGYLFEGRLKKSVAKDDQIIDELIYAITR